MPETTYGPDSAGSQAERTALAWSRTIISMAAVVAFVAIHGGIEGAPLPAVVALTAVAGALLLAAIAVMMVRKGIILIITQFPAP